MTWISGIGAFLALFSLQEVNERRPASVNTEKRKKYLRFIEKLV